MRSLGLIGLLLVGACALPASHQTSVAPADSTRHGGGNPILALALATFFVLWVIPGAGKVIRGEP